MANILTRIAGAAAQETASRSKDVLATAFPLLTAAPYQRALMSLPGMGFASAVGKKAGLFQTKEDRQKKEEEKTTKQTFTVLESILGEVVRIREGMQKFGREGKDIDSMTDVERAKQLRQLNPELSTQEALEKARRGGGYGKLDRRTKEIQQKTKDAEAVKKPTTVPKKPGMIARAGQAVAGAGRAVVGGVARAGAAVAGAAGTALPWLAAFAAVLPFFLPDDIKGVIGAIFRGLLEGIGLSKDTVDAIFLPFQILSEVAEVIKKVLGLLWDGIKGIVAGIGNIINWFGDRKSKNAAEEVSKATGGTGHGEFTTGAETGVPEVPQEAPSTPATPAAATRVPPPAPTPPTAVAVPPPTPTAPVATPAAPPPAMVPQTKEEKAIESKKLQEYFERPENAALDNQLGVLQQRIDTIQRAISSTKALIRSETDPVLKKQHEDILKNELEPGLERTRAQKKAILDAGRAAIKAESGGGASQGGAPASSPPPPTPSGAAGSDSAGSGSGAGGTSGSPGGGGDLAAGGGDASAPGAPAAASVPSTPTTGQDIGAQSKQIEADRMAGGAVEGSTNIIDKGEITAGTQEESAFRVPSPAAPRQEFDLDIFFTAAA